MRIKEAIRSSYFGQLMILRLHQVECAILPRIISDEAAIKKYYRKRTGKELHIIDPQTFTEKLNWYKLKVHDPLMTKCADKYEVRSYVDGRGFADTLNELYGVWDDIKEIDLDQLPEQFIMKATHGSHMNLFVKDKNKLDWEKEKKILALWLKQDIYWSGREWVYKDMPKRIIAEKYLGENIKDYKFYCFNGEPQYLDVDSDRFFDHFRNYYDMDWNLIPMACTLVRNDPDATIPKPKQFERMKEMAKALSAPFQFVRVDLYEIEGKIYFGELTFYQDGGFPGYPEEYDKRIGAMWKTREF